MSKFTDITQEQMEEFLSPLGFARVELDGTVELVYGKRIDRDGMPLTLRVYTGINPSGESREVGTDAIRVVLMGRNASGQVVRLATSRRVHRVEGWRKNLTSRLATVSECEVGPKCECGSPMVLRTARTTRKEFYGCSNFPTCKRTCPA